MKTCKKSPKSKFRASKIVKKAVFELLKTLKLISRKILMAETFSFSTLRKINKIATSFYAKIT